MLSNDAENAHNMRVMPLVEIFVEVGAPSAPQLPTPVGGGGVHYHLLLIYLYIYKSTKIVSP